MVITLVGAGNLATNLGEALQEARHEIRQVWSRTETSARRLSSLLHCSWTTEVCDIDTDTDIIILCVQDKVLEQIASQIKSSSLVLHTAGSISLSVLPQEHTGVLYPMQSFSKNRIAKFQEIPVFIEAKGKEDLATLKALAESISNSVYEMKSEKRMYLHLAAVFANNFTNHCFSLSSKILEQEGIPFNVMLPLIQETVDKIQTLTPREAQTGPAIRWDQNVMDKHIGMLDRTDKELYRLMSESIHNMHNND